MAVTGLIPIPDQIGVMAVKTVICPVCGQEANVTVPPGKETREIWNPDDKTWGQALADDLLHRKKKGREINTIECPHGDHSFRVELWATDADWG